MKKALSGKNKMEAVYKNAHDQRKGQFPGAAGLSPGPPQAIPFQSALCRRVHFFARPGFLSAIQDTLMMNRSVNSIYITP